MIGRDDVVLEIERALADGAPVVTLLGEAGIGKTTIWAEWIGRHTAAWTWTARCLEAERQIGLGVLADLFASVPADVASVLPLPQQQALRVVLFQDDQPELLAERLLGMTTLSVLRELSAQGSVALCIDDLQWCDRTSFDALNFAVHRVGATNVSVVTTRRLRTGTDLTGAHQITVGPLENHSMEQLIRTTTGPTLDLRDLSRLIERSGGNPLYARELARGATDRDATRLPASLRELLGGRLVAMGANTRKALTHVAVRGAPPIDQLRAERLDGGLDAAFRADLVVLDQGRVRFAHPLLATAVLEAAPHSDLRIAHRLAAVASADPVVSVLHRATWERPSEQLARALDGAVAVALGRGDRDGALRLAELALDLAPTPSVHRQRRLVRFARLSNGRGRIDRITAIAQELREITESPSATAEAIVLLGEATLPDYERAMALYKEAAALEGLPHDGEWREIVYAVAFCEHHAGRPLEALATLEAALAECGDLTPEWGDMVAALAFIGRLSGRPSAGRLTRLVAGVRDGIHPQALLPTEMQCAIGVCGELATLDDRHDEAADLLAEAELLAMHAGTLNRAGYARGMLYLRTGRLQDAERELRATYHFDLPNALGPARIALTQVWRGDVDGADACIREARSIANNSVGRAAVELNYPLAFADVLAGDHAAAWAQLAEAAARMAAIEHREPSHPPVLPTAIEAGARSGHVDEAERLCQRLEQDSIALDSRFGLAAALAARGYLCEARRQPADAEKMFRRSSAAFRDIGVVLEAARVELALAMALRRGGHRRAARDALLLARDTFATCGARGLVADCDAQLTRLGHRASAPSDLTASEQRVAELVATGMRNADIATALHLSVKTVETHISHTFRKLEVTNRTELARHLTINDS